MTCFLKTQEDIAAGVFLQGTARLAPIPKFAQNPRDVAPALVIAALDDLSQRSDVVGSQLSVAISKKHGIELLFTRFHGEEDGRTGPLTPAFSGKIFRF